MSESAQARADRMADEVFAKGGVSGSIYRFQFCNWLEAEIRAAERDARRAAFREAAEYVLGLDGVCQESLAAHFERLAEGEQ